MLSWKWFSKLWRIRILKPSALLHMANTKGTKELEPYSLSSHSFFPIDLNYPLSPTHRFREYTTYFLASCCCILLVFVDSDNFVSFLCVIGAYFCLLKITIRTSIYLGKWFAYFILGCIMPVVDLICLTWIFFERLHHFLLAFSLICVALFVHWLVLAFSLFS